MPHNNPELETLESRRLLAVTVTDGVLLGTPGDDVINIAPRGNGGVRITINGEKQRFNDSPLRHIRSLGGNDRIILKRAGPGDSLSGLQSIDASDGDDTIKSQLRIDALFGGAGHDRIIAGEGNDHISAGPGNDKVRAGGGNDVLRGEAGDDKLYGDAGNDQLYGDDPGGPDALGSDYLSGGAGKDGVHYTGRSAGLRISIDGERNDGAIGEADYVHADIEELIGGAGDDYLVGSDRDNTLVGNQGIDTIIGLGGDDVLRGEGVFVPGVPPAANHLYGGDDDDILNASGLGSTAFGGDGNDLFESVFGRMEGGAGNDTFDTRNNQRDTIDGGLGDDFAIIDELLDSHRSIESGIRPR